MFCKYCGEIIDDGSIYCRHCGIKLLQSTISNIESAISKAIPKKTKEKIQIQDPLFNEYDLIYQQDVRKYKVFGIIIILVVLLGILLKYYEAADIESIYTGSFILVIARFILSYKISSSVKELNRNSLLWWFFTFLLTGPALIVFGSLKMKLISDDFQTLTKKERASFLNKYAFKLAEDVNLYKKAESIINRAIEFDKTYYPAFFTRAYIKLFLKKYEEALEDATVAIEMDGSKGRYYYTRGHIYRKLNKLEAAYNDWKKASEDFGYAAAKDSIKLFCKKT